MTRIYADSIQYVFENIGDSFIAPLPERLRFSVADGHTSKNFAPKEILTKDYILEALFHKEGNKEGSCWCPATFADGHRANAKAEQSELAVLDCDRGDRLDDIVAAIECSGYAALVTSTHSHLTEGVYVSVTTWNRWCERNTGSDAPDYLIAHGYRDHVAAGATFVEVDGKKKVFPRKGDRFFKIRHAPCEKYRVQLFSKPWVRSNYQDARSAAKAYKEGLTNLADELGLTIDRAATDPARLFFDPRHRPGADCDAVFIPGTLAHVWPIEDSERPEPDFREFRYKALPIEDVRAMVDIIPNDHHFADRSAWIAMLGAIKAATGGSAEGMGVAEAWSASWTDGVHDSAAFEKAWSSLTDKPGGATVGTLIFHARRCGWMSKSDADELAPHGDAWNGKRFAARYRDKVLYVAATAEWMGYNEPAWDRLPAPALDDLCKAVSREVLQGRLDDFRSDPDNGRAEKLFNDARRVHSTLPLIRRFAEAGASEPGMFVNSPADFNRHNDLFCTRSHVIDLIAGSVVDCAPELFLSKRGGTIYDSAARAPKWTAFLKRTMPDPELRAFVQRAVGYTATGRVDEEVVFTLFGNGANGKSVFANVVSAAFGDYAASFGSALITKGKNDNEAARMVARMPGLRMALVNETAVGDIWDSQRLKELASREKMSARLLYREAFDFMPTAKIWIRTNHLPGVLDAGDGFWRRILAIPFTERILAAERIADLDRKIIQQELAGVFNWILEGVQKWRQSGLNAPLAVTAVTAEYRKETDLMGLWLEECCIERPNAKVKVSDAFESYADYCEKMGASAGTQMSFSRAMTSRGVRRDPRTAVRRFVGLELKASYGAEDVFADVEELV
ncbi:phage/plasmid primase, P4 family [Rhizobium sp. 814_E9_N1_1]|uniref:phage/plasmid primase, P4 family n=1 Tax=unclassified Rhizobium TaxID=2613769 RepID=UPI003F1E83BA